MESGVLHFPLGTCCFAFGYARTFSVSGSHPIQARGPLLSLAMGQPKRLAHFHSLAFTCKGGTPKALKIHCGGGGKTRVGETQSQHMTTLGQLFPLSLPCGSKL